MTTIKKISTYLLGQDQIFVKIETSQPGLFGWGSAAFAGHHKLIAISVDDYLTDFLVGKEITEIEDIWQTSQVQSSWRNDPALNCALSAIDQALWDIKGKEVGKSVVDLIGGRARKAVPVLTKVEKNLNSGLIDEIAKYQKEGIQYFLINPEMDSKAVTYGKQIVEIFSKLRSEFGEELHFAHDFDGRLAPTEALAVVKRLEGFHPFFLEDVFPPEHIDWHLAMRMQTKVPMATGKRFVNPHEWLNVIPQMAIDVVRCNISAIGGFSQALKIGHYAAPISIRTSWSAGELQSPIESVATGHLSLNLLLSGPQEWSKPASQITDVVDGLPELKNGYLYFNAKPGFGLEISEQALALLAS
jgi:mannonate dehydratase